jgi:hypothetical protein
LTDDTQAAASAAAPSPADQPPPNPAPEQNAAPEGQVPEAPEPELDDDGGEKIDLAKPLSKSQIRRLQRKAEFEALRDENARLRQSIPPPAPRQERTVNDLIGPPPDPRQFRDIPSYNAAVAAYQVHQGIATRQLAADKAAETERETLRQSATARSYAEKQAKARARLPDYDKVVGQAAGIQVSNAVSQAIIESDLAPDLEYHLAANPAKLHALNTMRPEQVAREIGRLEAVLASTPQARTSTQAPPPPTALKGGSAGPPKQPQSMNMDEYVAWRKSQDAA